MAAEHGYYGHLGVFVHRINVSVSHDFGVGMSISPPLAEE